MFSGPFQSPQHMPTCPSLSLLHQQCLVSSTLCTSKSSLQNSQSLPTRRPAWTSPASIVAMISQHSRFLQYTKRFIAGWSLMDACSVIKPFLSPVTWNNTHWATLGWSYLNAQLVRRLSLSQVTWQHTWRLTTGKRHLDVTSVANIFLDQVP